MAGTSSTGRTTPAGAARLHPGRADTPTQEEPAARAAYSRDDWQTGWRRRQQALEDGSRVLLPVLVVVAAPRRFITARILPTRKTAD